MVHPPRFDKYGKDHSPECLCEACQTGYTSHNSNRLCSCDWCNMHRKHALSRQPSTQQKLPRKWRGKKMSTVNICDRCESMVKGNALGDVELNTSQEPDRETLTRELCPDCVSELVLWMETTTEPVNRAHKHPWRRPDTSKSDAATSVEDVVRQAVRRELEAHQQDG